MKKALLSLILLLVLFPLKAQLETAHWYFGNRAGVDFTSGSPVADTNGALSTTEGCSSISDKEGNLLFYTDGVTVYDKTHEIMPNGTNLKGNSSSSQSAIIVPNAYNKNLYYIFTVDANDSNPDLIRGLHYSVVDMTLNLGNGDIIATQKNIPLALNGVNKSSEKITAVKHRNGKDIWVITHYLDSFYTFLVSSTGVSTTPVTSTVGVNIPFQIKDKIVYPNNGRGYVKASPNGKKIAIAHLSAIQESDYNKLPDVDYRPNCMAIYAHGGVLGLYDFNNATGTVSNEIILSPGGKKAFYGVEFSPNSKVLYAEYDTFKGDLEVCYEPISIIMDNNWIEGRLVQFNLAAANISNSEFTIHLFDKAKFNAARGALQTALDRKIYYVSGADTYRVSAINNPNVLGAGANFNFDAISLQRGQTARYGLPPFIVSFFDGNISVNGSLGISDICINETVTFSLDTDIDSPYTIDWNFGDGNTSNNPTPSHTYLALGVYMITATVYYDGGSEVFTKEITISPIPVVDLGTDITTCDATPIILDAGNAGSTYLWSTGETTQTIAVSASGSYSVEVTNTSGCIGSDKVEITFDSSLHVDLGTDITTCDVTPIVLNAGNAGSTYLWNTGETTKTIAVGASGTYSVVVTNASGCIGTDKIEITISPKPVVDLGMDILTCGYIRFILDAGNPGSTYLWSTGETTQTIEVSTSSTYSVEVTNASGCTGADEKTITYGPGLMPHLGADIITCKTEPIILDAGYDDSYYTYLWSTGETTKTIAVSDSGTYSVAVANASGCTGSDEVAVTFNSALIVDLGADITTCDATPIVLNAGNIGSTYLWSTGETTQTIAVGASGTYSVAVTNASGCLGSDEVEVTFNANILVDLGADITTCDATPIVLNAGNAGSTYLWSTGETTQTIEVTTSGTYSVAVTNASGCTGSDEVEVTFSANMLVDLGADITTCDATPIVLNAGNIGSAYLWNTGETTQTIEVTTSGIYSVAVTNASGCIGSDEVAVTFNANILVDLGADITTCDATPIVLNAGNIGSTYLWSTGETTQTITVSTSGIYSVAVTNASGCIGSDEVAVTFNANILVDLGADITTCDATPIVLNAGNAGSTYLWSTGETTQTITVTTSGTYSVAVANISGCTDSDEVKVSFSANMLVDLGADITTCDATPIVLNAGNIGSTYLWNTGETTQTITVTTSSTYSVAVANISGCTGSDEVAVTFNSALIVDLGADITTCEAAVILDSGHSPTDATIVWTLPDGTTQSGTQTIEAKQSGKYTVSITKEGCTTTDEIKVTLSAKPYIIEVKTNGNSVELIAKGNRPLEYSLDTIHWQASPYFTDLAYGIHSAYVRDAYGCTSDAFDFGLLNIPNIITPNGDGKNDAWNLKGLELYPGSKIQIFDRYGKPLVNKVFTENPAWDGKYLNKPVPSTTYWYIIELTDGRKLNGSITVKNY